MVRRVALCTALIAFGWVGTVRASAPPIATNGYIFGAQLLGKRVYVTGEFSFAGRPTGAMAGFDGASGAIDAAFGAIDGQVSDAIPDGRGGWFIGGEFRAIGAIKRRYVAHLNPDG